MAGDVGQSITRPEAISDPPGIEPVAARHVDYMSALGNWESIENTG